MHSKGGWHCEEQEEIDEEVCVWRLKQSTQAINDFEDKPLSSVSGSGLCIFLPHHAFLAYFLPFVLHFKQLHGDVPLLCSHFCPFYFFISWSYQRNALRAQCYPCPLFSSYTQYSLWQCGPLLLSSFRTWWQMKQPSLTRWLWAGGCGWWVVQGYHVKTKQKKGRKRKSHIYHSLQISITNWNVSSAHYYSRGSINMNLLLRLCPLQVAEMLFLKLKQALFHKCSVF